MKEKGTVEKRKEKERERERRVRDIVQAPPPSWRMLKRERSDRIGGRERERERGRQASSKRGT